MISTSTQAPPPRKSRLAVRVCWENMVGWACPFAGTHGKTRRTGDCSYTEFQIAQRSLHSALWCDKLHPLAGDPGLAAAVCAQTTDVEIEVNGLSKPMTARWSKWIRKQSPQRMENVPAAARAGFAHERLRQRSLDKDVMKNKSTLYVSNREPLLPSPFMKLPIGSITPKGWLAASTGVGSQRDDRPAAGNLKWCKFEGNAWASRRPGPQRLGRIALLAQGLRRSRLRAQG